MKTPLARRKHICARLWRGGWIAIVANLLIVIFSSIYLGSLRDTASGQLNETWSVMHWITETLACLNFIPAVAGIFCIGFSVWFQFLPFKEKVNLAQRTAQNVSRLPHDRKRRVVLVILSFWPLPVCLLLGLFRKKLAFGESDVVGGGITLAILILISLAIICFGGAREQRKQDRERTRKESNRDLITGLLPSSNLSPEEEDRENFWAEVKAEVERKDEGVREANSKGEPVSIGEPMPEVRNNGWSLSRHLWIFPAAFVGLLQLILMFFALVDRNAVGDVVIFLNVCLLSCAGLLAMKFHRIELH